MTKSTLPLRPDIFLSAQDHDTLSRLVGDMPGDGVAGMLQEELERAVICEPGDLPKGAVPLNRWLHYIDGRASDPRRIQIVLPHGRQRDAVARGFRGLGTLVGWRGLHGQIHGHTKGCDAALAKADWASTACAFMTSRSAMVLATMGVSIGPGPTALMRKPVLAHSKASDLTMPLRPALEAA